jgi:orotidine-5'-phosphate decarboxylase
MSDLFRNMPPIARRPSVASFGSRLEQTFAKYGQLCVGIDPSQEQLLSWGLPDNAEGAKKFAFDLVEACVDKVGIVKPQVAFFEQFGAAGLKALSEVLESARNAGLLVIADAKRGDIGSSMAGYTRAWLSAEAVFQTDALTISPFLGLESLRSSIEAAIENDKGVFLLAATSNPEAAIIQKAATAKGSIASEVVSFAASFNKATLGSVGVVVGATLSLQNFGLATESFPSTPILMPGFGAQGAKLSSTRDLFGDLTSNLICSVSRSVAGETSSGLSERIVSAKLELGQGME